MSNDFVHRINDNAQKTYNIGASQYYTKGELPFLTAKPTIFVSEKQFLHSSQTISQTELYNQVTEKSSAKLYKNVSPETEPINRDRSINFKKYLIQTEELIEPHRANI